MDCKIRPFKDTEFEMIRQWYLDAGVNPPESEMLMENGTLVVELDGIPAIAQTILFTQSKSFCFLECLIKNPVFKGINLEPYLVLLANTLFELAKEQGYKNMFTYGNVGKLKDKYKRLGFTQSLDNLSAFYRRL